MIAITQTLQTPQSAITFVNDKSQTSLLESNHFIWLVAIMLSLATHAALFYHKNNQHNAVPDMVTQETITHVRFASISPPPITVIEPDIKPEIKPPEPVVSQPKIEKQVIEEKKPVPVIKPKAIKKNNTPKPKPKPKKTTPKPAQKKITVNKPPVKVQKTSPKPQVNKEVKRSPIVSNADQRLIEQTRKSYFALLMRHIEAHKNYPRVARKRKIEGKIIISFSLLADGSIKNLQVNGKRSILEKASKNAISNSLPMPFPPKDLSLPMKVKFTMNYFLK